MQNRRVAEVDWSVCLLRRNLGPVHYFEEMQMEGNPVPQRQTYPIGFSVIGPDGRIDTEFQHSRTGLTAPFVLLKRS